MPANLSKHADGLVRTFVAIELRPAVRATLAALERELAECAPSLRWVAPELLHLTLRFLGMLPSGKVQVVGEAAGFVTLDTPPLDLALDSVGAFFATSRMPRVIWVGLRRDSGYESLQTLFARLEDELARRGFDREPRRFAPHLTIARVREGLSETEGGRLREAIDKLSTSRELTGTIEVRDLTVMRSDLTPRGPRYTPLCRVPLKGDAGS